MQVIKVRKEGESAKIGGAIAGSVRDCLRNGTPLDIKVMAMGADAVYRAIQSIATATDYLRHDDPRRLVSAVAFEATTLPAEGTPGVSVTFTLSLR